MNRRHNYIPLIAFLLFAYILRIYQIDDQALSGDEAFSVLNWGRVTLNHLLNTVAVIDPQPPVALLSFWGWTKLIGESEFSIRMLSLLASMVTLSAIYAITTTLLNRQAALIAIFLGSVSTHQIWNAQDARHYALWMALSSLSLLAMLRAAKRPDRVGRWTMYALTASLALYTYYLEALFLLVHNIYLLFASRRRETVIKWIGSQFLIALILAPWFLQPALTNSTYQPTGTQGNILHGLAHLLAGDTNPTWQPQHLLVFLSIFILCLGLYATYRLVDVKATVLLTSLSTVPITALTLLALLTHKGYYRVRYVSPTSTALIILIAIAVYYFSSTQRLRPLTRLITPLIFTVYIGLNATSYLAYRTDPAFAKAPRWRQLRETLTTQLSQVDNGIVVRNYPDPAFDYYMQDHVPNITIPTFENAANDVIAEQTADVLETYQHIWFLPQDGVWDPDQIALQTFEDQSLFLLDQWVGSTHILLYANPYPTTPAEPQILLDHNFDSIITLTGANMFSSQASLEPGSTFSVELFWNTVSNDTRNLTVFMQLIGPARPDGSQIWAQDDHPPQQGRISPQTWELDRTFADVHTLQLPEELPSAEYTIITGIYDPKTGERLTTLSGADNVEILTFSIK